MPTPIRPVRELEQNIPAVLSNGGFSALSPLQQMMLGDAAKAEAQLQIRKIVKIDVRDAENLHKIWLANDGGLVKMSSSSDEDAPLLMVPPEIEDYELMRLKTNGLVVGNGRQITPTKKGNKILRDTILKAGSDFQMKRTREKYRPLSEGEDDG